MHTDSYRGIALPGLMPTLPAIIFRLAALCVLRSEKPGTEIQPVTHQNQRDQQTGTAKQRYLFEYIDL
jgi:hypothetical protein